MSAATNFHQLSEQGISAHAWNGDRSMIAICPNSNEVHIYSGCTNPDPATWTRSHVLAEHDLLVSGIDWSPVTNKLVTCSHDRNAFVWTFQDNEWKPSLVILRINRAAIDVKWSPDGSKFAVASAAKSVPVCHYEESNDWWISKMIKKHKSTVLEVAWHPNNQLLLTGCSDFKCRIFSAFVEECEEQLPDGAGPFGATQPFGELLAEFDQARGWVESVAWSPSGSRLAFAGHDSSLTVVTFQGSQPEANTNRFNLLPLSSIMFLNEDTIVGGGHEFNPAVFTADNTGTFVFQRSLDAKSSAPAPAAASSGGFANARAMFQSKTTRGQAKTDAADSLWTKHENVITQVTSRDAPGAANVTQIATTGLDGRIVMWRI